MTRQEKRIQRHARDPKRRPDNSPEFMGRFFVGKIGDWIEELNRALADPANGWRVDAIFARRAEYLVLADVLKRLLEDRG